MIDGLIKFANKLDRLGLSKEADAVDSFVRKLIISGEITKLAQQSDELEEINKRISELKALDVAELPITPSSLNEDQKRELANLEAEKIKLTQKMKEEKEGVDWEKSNLAQPTTEGTVDFFDPTDPEFKAEEAAAAERMKVYGPQKVKFNAPPEENKREEIKERSKKFLTSLIDKKFKSREPLNSQEIYWLKRTIVNSEILKDPTGTSDAKYGDDDVSEANFVETLQKITGLSDPKGEYLKYFKELNERYENLEVGYSPSKTLSNAMLDGEMVRISYYEKAPKHLFLQKEIRNLRPPGQKDEVLKNKIIKPLFFEYNDEIIKVKGRDQNIKATYVIGEEYTLKSTPSPDARLGSDVSLSRTNGEPLKIRIFDITDVSFFNLRQEISDYEESAKAVRESVELTIPSTWEEVSGVPDRTRMLNSRSLFESSSINDLINSKLINVLSAESLSPHDVLLLHTFLLRLSDPRYKYPASIADKDGRRLENLAPSIFKYDEKNRRLEFLSNEYKLRRVGIERTFRERENYREYGRKSEIFSQVPEKERYQKMRDLIETISDEEKRSVATALGRDEIGKKKLINLLKKGYKDFNLYNLMQKMSEAMNSTSDENWKIFPGFNLFKSSPDSPSGYVTSFDVIADFGGITPFTSDFLDTLTALGYIYKADKGGRIIYVGNPQMVGDNERIEVTVEGEVIESSSSEQESVLEKIKRGDLVENVSAEDVEKLLSAQEEQKEDISVDLELQQINDQINELKTTPSYKKVESIMKLLQDRSKQYLDKYPQSREKIIKMEMETARILTEIGKPLSESGQEFSRELEQGPPQFFTRVLKIDDRRSLFNTPVPEETILRKALFLSEIMTDQELFVAASLPPRDCENHLRGQIKTKTRSELIMYKNLYIKSRDEEEKRNPVFADQPKLREELRMSSGGAFEALFGGKDKLSDAEVIAALASSYETATLGYNTKETQIFKLSFSEVENFVFSNFKDMLDETFKVFVSDIDSKTKELETINQDLLGFSATLKKKISKQDKERIQKLVEQKEVEKQQIINKIQSISEKLVKDEAGNVIVSLINPKNNKFIYQNLFKPDYLYFLGKSRRYDDKLPALLALLKASVSNTPYESGVRNQISQVSIKTVRDAKTYFSSLTPPVYSASTEYSPYQGVVIDGVNFGQSADASYASLKEDIRTSNILSKEYLYGFPKKFKSIREDLFQKLEEVQNSLEYKENPNDEKFKEINKIKEIWNNPESKEFGASENAKNNFFNQLDLLYAKGKVDGIKIEEDMIKDIVRRVVSEDKGVGGSEIQFSNKDDRNSAARIARALNLIIRISRDGSEKIIEELKLKNPNLLNDKKSQDLLIRRLILEAQSSFRLQSPITKQQYYTSFADKKFITNIMFLAQDGIYSKIKENIVSENETISRSNILNLSEEYVDTAIKDAKADREDPIDSYKQTYSRLEVPREIEEMSDEETDGWILWIKKLGINSEKNVISPIAIKEIWNKSCANISVIPIYKSYDGYVKNRSKRKKMISSSGSEHRNLVAESVQTKTVKVKDPKTGLEKQVLEIVKVSPLPNYFSWEDWTSKVFGIDPDEVTSKVSTKDALKVIQMAVDISDNSINSELIDVLNRYLNNENTMTYFATRMAEFALREVKTAAEIAEKKKELDMMAGRQQYGREFGDKESQVRKTQEADFGLTEEEQESADIIEDEDEESFEFSEEVYYGQKARKKRVREEDEEDFEGESEEEEEEPEEEAEPSFKLTPEQIQAMSPEQQAMVLRGLDRKKRKFVAETALARTLRDASNNSSRIQVKVMTMSQPQQNLFLKSLCSLSLQIVKNPAMLYTVAPQLADITKIQEMEEQYNLNLAVAVKKMRQGINKGELSQASLTDIFKEFPEIERMIVGQLEKKSPKSKEKTTTTKERTSSRSIIQEGSDLFEATKKTVNNLLERQKVFDTVESLESQSEATQTEPAATTQSPESAPAVKPGLGVKPKPGLGAKPGLKTKASITYDRYSYINYVNSLLKR